MSVEELKFYLSAEQPCSYLDGRISASVFADPDGRMTPSVYSVLINHGFRRSSNYVYRPHCSSCNACKPTRIPVHFFKPNRSQQRIWNRNQDVQVIEKPAAFDQAHFDLYRKYVGARHAEGEMDHDDPKRYFDFLGSKWCDTVFYEFRLNEKLVAVAVTDVLLNGLSALYTFYDPEFTKRSLGTYAILWQIKETAKLKRAWLYLGYWIENCQKMKYKSQFSPLEIWEKEEWKSLEKPVSSLTLSRSK